MPDIKTEKPLVPKEKPVIKPESFKHGSESESVIEKFKNFEQLREKVAEEITRTENRVPSGIGPVGAVSAPQAKQQKQIENVLSSGLEEVYLNLSPAKRQEFRKTGEETAKKINQLMSHAKVKIGDIVKLIKKWLALIPGVNKYFLEQEAKIKADEIMKMRK